MKCFIPLCALVLAATSVMAQEKLDTLQSQLSAIQNPELPDSLKTAWLSVDSVRRDFNQSTDSLQQAYQKSIGSINTEASRIQSVIDSLNNINAPVGWFPSKLDSLNKERKNLENNLNTRLDKLKSKTIGKLDKIEMTPEMEGPVGAFTQKVNAMSVSGDGFVKIPPVQVDGYTVPNIGELDGLSSITGSAGGLPELSKIETPLGQLGDVTGQVDGLGEDIKNISQGNLADVEQIPETIEQQATRIEGVEELQKQSFVVDGYKDQLDAMGDPDALKQQGKHTAKKQAINHFAGKEEQLKAAMDKMSKVKQKYSSVRSLKDLPKRPPNAMKGKPFIERVVPGLYLQFQLKNAWLLDVNPYAGYKISGRFTSGIGWNQRFAYDRKIRTLLPGSRIYGPRGFIDVKLGKGFIAHLEQEVMNTYVPPLLKASNPEEGKREWVWSTMLGIKKQYKIYKNLNGTVLIQYNLFNPYYRAPYLDRLNSRMGFEYTLKKKKALE